MQADYDCIIVGAGMVGATLAIALEAIGLRTAVVEASAGPAPPAADQRGLALALSTHRIFTGLGIWPDIEPRVTPIRRIHISDRGRFGFTELHAADIDADALAYVCPAGHLAAALRARVRTLANCTEYCPARPVAIHHDDDGIVLQIDRDGSSENLAGRLLIAADGSASGVRELLGLGVHVHDYQRSAVVAAISVAQPQADTAFERFTSHGPIALLPMGGKRYVAVWTHEQARVDETMHLDDDEFATRLHTWFGNRLGAFSAPGRRGVFPLRLSRVSGDKVPRALVIGNAATAVHPNAAQGLNLGLRDVATLVDCLAEARRNGQDSGAAPVLSEFTARRRRDRDNVVRFTDTLARVFASEFPPAIAARDLTMLAIDLIPPLKREFIRRAAGIADARDRLLRGVPISGAGHG